ncbi:NAD(P)/FAD-dependent oxidoreductase [Kribbella sp. NPDC056861]|uniref:FAD-dependent oxidoreductase n=1 Tax=Kribbella sp. NPDC056861 TaxID=3154857 RepID=UPI003428ECB9
MTRIARVAGAGIAGLAVATALGRRGWRVVVYERAPQLREIGAGITLGPDGIEVLERLGALTETIADAAKVGYWYMQDEQGRNVQAQHVTREMYCCHRRSLHRALVNTARAAGAEIHTRTPVAGVLGDALLVGDVPVAVPADLIVGADGVGSRVRRSLATAGLGVRLVDLNVSGARYVIPRRATEWLTDQPEWLRDSRRVGVLPLGGDDIAVWLSCRRDDSESRTDPLEREHWLATFPEARDVIERAPDRPDWRDLVEIRCSRWSAGNAVLVGDSAFAMASNLGQGALSALRAALELSEEVADSLDIPSALTRWERRVRPLIDYNQSWSHRYNAIATRWPGRLYPLRSALYRRLDRIEELNHRFAGV